MTQDTPPQTAAALTLKWRGKDDDPMVAKFGDYLGGGDGEIAGPAIHGSVEWDLYEIQHPASCDATFLGRITTRDGAEIGFESLGFFKPAGDGRRWRLASSIRFTTDDERYAGFDHCVGLMDGEFDATTYRHDYRINLPDCADSVDTREAGDVDERN